MSGGARLQATAGGSVTMVVDDTLTTDEVVEIETKGSIGYGQTWQDVKASRAVGTTYTNNTGKPIQVSVTVLADSGQIPVVRIDGIITAYGTSIYSTGKGSSIQIIIPNGSTYQVSCGGTPSILLWSELRGD